MTLVSQRQIEHAINYLSWDAAMCIPDHILAAKLVARAVTFPDSEPMASEQAAANRASGMDSTAPAAFPFTPLTPPPFTGRAKLVHDMSKAILSDRNKAYGNPEDNFKNIADVWNWYLEAKLPKEGGAAAGLSISQCLTAMKILPLDVAHMMTLMKMARLKTNPTHYDSMVDAAGYQGCAADFVKD